MNTIQVGGLVLDAMHTPDPWMSHRPKNALTLWRFADVGPRPYPVFIPGAFAPSRGLLWLFNTGFAQAS
jgi:hypothetical protein